MANTIVKHRIGTTAEWLDIDLIPENGELVIEVCPDGTRKCKIGTGVTRYSRLPYVDEAVRVELLKEFDKLKNNLEGRLTEVIDKQTSDYSILTAELARIEQAQKQANIDITDTMLEHTTKIYAEIADLVDDDITILERVFASTNLEHSKEINALKTESERHNSLIEHNKQQITQLSEANSQIEDAIESLNVGFTEELTNKVNNQDFDSELTAVYDKFEQVNESINEKVDKKATALEFETLHNRIDLFTSLPDGSTAGDAELLDIRNGYNGQIHASAGSAVRAVGNDVQALRNSLSQYIDTQAIDGLHYDKDGEVGLMQPYMLYLTAGNEIIQDSGVQIISGAGGGGGGGSSSLKISYITQSPMIVTPSDKAIVYFTFSGTDSSGDIIRQASATWRINGVTIHGTVKDGENEFDATKYLTTGTNRLSLLVSDGAGSAVPKNWDIQQIELAIASAFNDKRSYPANEPIIFDYTPFGAIDKVAIFKLDGQIIDRVQLGKEISGSTISYELPAQKHGSHLLDVQLEADINGETVTSDHAIKDILWYDPTSTSPIIGATTQNYSVKQYSTTNILYTVYDPVNENPTVNIEIDGSIVASYVLKPNKDYEDTLTDIYSYIAATPGAHVVKIICGNTQKVINIFVEDVGVNISPVTTGLAFDFNPAGRSNGDANRLWSHNGVNLSVSENFDWINGGYIPDDPDGPCFCIKAGSSATIDYKLFANEAKVSGKEFKIIFKTKNVSNPDAIFVSCLDNTTSKDHIGLSMGVHTAHVYGKNGNLELAYSEEDVVELEFNISKDTEAVPMVMGYEDGVPSRPMVYDSTYSFKQNNPKEITLGSPDCDVYIYRLKVYNTSLSATNILNNFIADARTADEMISRHNRNQIYDENQKLTAEVLAEKCPWLRIYKVSAPHFTNSKSDKVPDTTIQQIYLEGDPVLDNWIAYNSQHSGQGTSSNNYGAAGRNLDFIMNKSSSYFELSDGTITDSITLTRDSVPVAYLNAKVNIASSNNLTNAILANRYNKFNPYKRPFVREEGYAIDNIKDTMEFYNCVIFIQETDPDLTTHREFADNDWHFYAIGNIGDSKKTDKTRLTDQEDPYECCVEIMDVGLPLSAFPRDTMVNAMSYSVDEKTGEKNYTWAKDANLGILYEKQEDGSYVLTADTTVDFDKIYYVDILEHDDFSEDFTYGWRYISDDEDPEIVNTCKQAWIDFYRFVTTSSDDDFKANLGTYFAVDSALFYYLFTTRYCMVDNRAKNTFWHYGKAADGSRKWDLCWDYDNDTSLGLNNFGKQVYRYGLEDIDSDEAGTEVFRQSDSLFFCRIRDLFGNELKQMYQDLESKDAWKASSFIKECDDWQEQFPEELWRVDIERKYIRTYTSSFINGKGDKQFLTNMANGRMKYHRRQWERSQEQYMASKYQTTTALSEDYHANFRVNRFDSTADLAIQPSYQFTLTPYSYMYLNVKYGGTTPISVRAVPNVPTVVPYAGTDADIINIGSAASIRDFGDLSALYPDTVSVQNAARVKKLKIGNSTPGYENAGFSSLTTGANGLLEELDITNITSFEATLDLRELINLTTLYAFGTNIPGVMFAEGGKLSYAELPALNGLTIKNLGYLTTEGLKLSSYENVVDLTVENCPLIDQLSLFESCLKNKEGKVKLINVKLDNIQFGTKTYEYFENNLFAIANITLSGAVHFAALDGQQFNNLRARYPKLTITYDSLSSNIKFMDTDLESVIYEQTVLNAGDCQDPSTTDNWTAPIKLGDQEFAYAWFGWSEVPNVLVNYENLPGNEAAEAEAADYNKYYINSIKHVEGDRILYPVFKTLRNKYEVQFINPTDSNRVLYSVMVPYGRDAVYVGETPKKLDVTSTSVDLYEFIGWYPTPERIVDHLTCEAQFAVKDQDRLPGGEDDGDSLPGYTLNWLDMTNCIDPLTNELLNGDGIGYKLNTSNSTMSTISISNKFNTAFYIPETLQQNGTDYTVVTVGGFKNHGQLEFIILPDSVKEISATGFYQCARLSNVQLPKNLLVIGSAAFQGCNLADEITIPETVTSIGDAAFAQCSGLEKINVDEKNSYFSVLQDGQMLIENATGKLIQGLSGSNLTSNMGDKIRVLGNYCFANTLITSAHIPEGVEQISTNAFSRCTELEELSLPSTLIKLDATCFSWCPKLTTVELPVGLTDIGTYVFNSSSLVDLEIPKTVKHVRAQSFGNIKTLKTVTFKKHLNADGSVFIPEIDEKAFSGSGDEIVFNVPWSAGETPLAPWGATNATINYDCEV
jgi:hypothetical protein